MRITPEWLKRKIEGAIDPESCEAGTPLESRSARTKESMMSEQYENAVKDYRKLVLQNRALEAKLAEQEKEIARIEEIANRAIVLAAKWVDANHHDWDEVKSFIPNSAESE